MKPTLKLRFVERTVITSHAQMIAKTVRVLQQWWEEKQWAHDDWIIVGGEWRDVPLEQEQT
jgi:hypothetical protein